MFFPNKNTISKTSDSKHGYAWRKIIGTMFHLCPIIENVHKFHETESISNESLNHAQKLVIQHLYYHSTPNCWRPNGNNSSGINPGPWYLHGRHPRACTRLLHPGSSEGMDHPSDITIQKENSPFRLKIKILGVLSVLHGFDVWRFQPSPSSHVPNLARSKAIFCWEPLHFLSANIIVEFAQSRFCLANYI